MRKIIRLPLLAVATLTIAAPLHGQAKGKGKSQDTKGPAAPAAKAATEAAIIADWFRTHQTGLPPGLSKKDALPPGLAKQLQRNGKLPPGLEKKIRPLPPALVRILPPLPAGRERIIIGTQVVIHDRTTQKIIDLIDILLP